MTTPLPTLTCDADATITRQSVDAAMQGKSAPEQEAAIAAWFQHLRSISGDTSIRMQGITYAPNAQGRLEVESPARTLEANKTLLASSLSRLCPSR